MMEIFILLNKCNNGIIFLIIWIADLIIYITYIFANYINKINYFLLYIILL